MPDMWVWIVLGLIVVIAIIVIALLMRKSRRDKQNLQQLQRRKSDELRSQADAAAPDLKQQHDQSERAQAEAEAARREAERKEEDALRAQRQADSARRDVERQHARADEMDPDLDEEQARQLRERRESNPQRLMDSEPDRGRGSSPLGDDGQPR